MWSSKIKEIKEESLLRCKVKFGERERLVARMHSLPKKNKKNKIKLNFDFSFKIFQHVHKTYKEENSILKPVIGEGKFVIFFFISFPWGLKL